MSTSDADTLLANAEALRYAEPGRSLSLTKKAMHHYSISGNAEGMANSNFLLGRLFYFSGAFSQSIRYQQEALKWYSRLVKKQAIAEVHSSLGTTYYFARQPEKAMQEQQTAMAIYMKLNDSKGIARTLTRIGHLREKEKKAEQALQLQIERSFMPEKRMIRSCMLKFTRTSEVFMKIRKCSPKHWSIIGWHMH